MKPSDAVQQFESWERARKELEATFQIYKDDPTPENEALYTASLKRFADLVDARYPPFKR